MAGDRRGAARHGGAGAAAADGRAIGAGLPRLRRGMALAGAQRTARADRRLARVAGADRARLRQDPGRRRMGVGAGARGAGRANRPGRRQPRRGRPGDDRGRERAAQRRALRRGALVAAVAAGDPLSLGRDRAGLFGRRPGQAARTATPFRLVRRARQMAASGLDLGQFADGPQARRAAADRGDDDAGAGGGAEGDRRGPRYGKDARANARQSAQRARLPDGDARTFRGHAAWAAGAGRRAVRRCGRRAVDPGR